MASEEQFIITVHTTYIYQYVIFVTYRNFADLNQLSILHVPE